MRTASYLPVGSNPQTKLEFYREEAYGTASGRRAVDRIMSEEGIHGKYRACPFTLYCVERDLRDLITRCVHICSDAETMCFLLLCRDQYNSTPAHAETTTVLRRLAMITES